MLHHEIGGAVLEIAAVDQARDGGVIERREDVPFAVQPAAQSRMQCGMLQHLDRHRLLVLRIVALAAIYRAHAAMAENRHHPVRTDARTDQPIPVIFQQRFGGRPDGILKRVLAPAIEVEQRGHRQAEFGVAAAALLQLRGALADVDISQLLEQGLNLLPARARNHVDRVPPISLSNQARDRRMSRCTVAAEVPVAAAISS